MTLKRFLTVLSLVTLGALLYTHQQLGLVRMSYALDERHDQWQIASQRHSYLQMKVLALASPQQLDHHLSQAEVHLAFPPQTRVVRVAKAAAERPAVAWNPRLAWTSEAEASIEFADISD